MDETTKSLTSRNQGQNDIEKHIPAFQKHVVSAESKFSINELQKALEHISTIPFPMTPRREYPTSYTSLSKTVSSKGKSSVSFASIQEVRNLLQKVKRKSGKTMRDTESVKTLEGFLQSYQFMRTMQQHFIVNIYGPLYSNFHDPSVLLSQEKTCLTQDEIVDNPPSVTNGTFFLTESKFDEDNALCRHLLQQLNQSISLLYDVFSRWKRMCENDAESLKWYNLEETTQQRLKTEFTSHFTEKNEEQTRELPLLLYLLPDLFYKAHRCTELARDWMVQYIQCQLTLGNRSHSDGITFEQTVKDWEILSLQLEKENQRLNQILHLQSEDVQFLKSREARFDQLVHDVDDLGRYRDESSANYSHVVQERQMIIKQLENTVQGTQRFTLLNNKLLQLELEMLEKYKDYQFAEYKLNLYVADCKLEGHTATDFQIFCDSEEEKIRTTRDMIQQTLQKLHYYSKQREIWHKNIQKRNEIVLLYSKAPKQNNVLLPADIDTKTYVIPNHRQADQLETVSHKTYTIKKTAEVDKPSDYDSGIPGQSFANSLQNSPPLT